MINIIIQIRHIRRMRIHTHIGHGVGTGGVAGIILLHVWIEWKIVLQRTVEMIHMTPRSTGEMIRPLPLRRHQIIIIHIVVVLMMSDIINILIVVGSLLLLLLIDLSLRETPSVHLI